MVRRMLRSALRHRSSRSLTLASVAFVSFVLGACSKGGKDDGLDDGPSGDGGAVRDSGVLPVPPGDLAGSRDPALCPVGAADGCCPLLRHGGTDPDCPSLGCSALVRSTPIQLDAAAVDYDTAGQVGLAWNGRELAAAWTEYVPDFGTGKSFLHFERYSLDGRRTFGPMRQRVTDSAARLVPGVTDLGYEPMQDTYILATTNGGRYAALGLDRDGKPGWLTQLGDYCDSLTGHVRVLPIGTEALIAQQQGCSSSMQPRADFLQPGGASAASVLLGDGMRPNQSSSGVFAFDPRQRRLLAVYQREYEKTLMGRYVDAATHKPQAAFEIAPAATSPARTELGLAFDGQRYGVLIETRQSTSSFAQHFQLYAATGGWVGQPAQLGSPRAVLPPSVIWTGSGYLVAAMTFDGPGLPIDPSRFTARLWSLTADGTLRELFDVDRMPAIYPTLVWAGGRVALAWVRLQGSRATHMLQFLSCG